MSELISIIIPNYNGEQWLEACLHSISLQTYSKWEVIISNNSPSNLDYLINKYNNVKIVQNKKNIGFAGAINSGIQQAEGIYILLLNNDTILNSDFLQKITAEYTGLRVDVLAPFETEYENPTYRKYLATIDPFGHPIYVNFNTDQKKSFYLSGFCCLFRKEFYVTTGGMDENFFMYFEEIDWFWRLHLMGNSIRQSENIFVCHNGAWSEGGKLRYNTFLWRNENCLQMLLKNYAWFNLVWVLPIYLLQNLFEMFFFYLSGKSEIAASYVRGWAFNIKHISRTLKGRRKVQSMRKISDTEILKKMYPGFGKINHMVKFYSRTKNE